MSKPKKSTNPTADERATQLATRTFPDCTCNWSSKHGYDEGSDCPHCQLFHRAAAVIAEAEKAAMAKQREACAVHLECIINSLKNMGCYEGKEMWDTLMAAFQSQADVFRADRLQPYDSYTRGD